MSHQFSHCFITVLALLMQIFTQHETSCRWADIQLFYIQQNCVFFFNSPCNVPQHAYMRIIINIIFKTKLGKQTPQKQYISKMNQPTNYIRVQRTLAHCAAAAETFHRFFTPKSTCCTGLFLTFSVESIKTTVLLSVCYNNVFKICSTAR